MSNYTKSTNFATKDALASGNPLKIVKGTEIDTEFNNIATAVATKADLASPTFTGTPSLPTGTTGVTQTAGTNNTTLATTAFVQAAVSAIPAAFPSGTAMLFVQTSAPTGWTKSTTHNDKTLRVVSGSASSGGSSAFSTVFANQTPTISNTFSIASTTLTTSQIPSHTHDIQGFDFASAGSGFYSVGTGSAVVSGATGGGGSHTHTLSGSATSSAITLNVQYVDVIIATKD